MNRVARFGVLAAAVVSLTVALAGPAQAGLGGYNPPAGPTGGAPTSGSTTGSSGGPQHKTVRSCSLFATSSNFGLSCITGDGTNGVSLQKVLGFTGRRPNPVPTCWDTLISAHDLAVQYHYAPFPAAPYYLHSCIAGLILHNPLSYQPTVQLNQEVIEIPVDAPKCDTTKPYLAVLKGVCVMTLIQHQQTVVDATAHKGGKIPGILISQQPSTNVRTNQDVAYVDAAADVNGNRINRTRNYAVGGVTLWAQMTSFRIYPHGPDGPSTACNGTAEVRATDTRATKPDACWWKYERSSADQPGEAYAFRAEATWQVFYETGGVTTSLATFQKYDDLTIPVSDIQSIVVH